MNNINLGDYDEKNIQTTVDSHKYQNFPISEMVTSRKAKYWLFAYNKSISPDNSTAPCLDKSNNAINAHMRNENIIKLIEKN